MIALNRRQFASLLLLVLLVLAVGVIWRWSRSGTIHLTLATAAEDGTFHSLGGLIAAAIHDSDQRIKVKVLPSAGSDHNIELLANGDANLAIVQNDTHPRFIDVHTLIPLHQEVLHFLVPRDSSIQSIHDLPGKTVGVGKVKSGNLHLVVKLLEHFGIGLANGPEVQHAQLKEQQQRHHPDDEVWAVYDGVEGCRNALEAGEIDALLVLTSLSSPSLSDLVRHGRVRYVSLAESIPANEVDGFVVTYPYVERFTIPRYVYPVHDARHGLPSEPCESFSSRSTLVSRGDLPDDVARTIVAAIVSHRTTMMRRNQEARDITEHFDPVDVQFAMHHGAMAYYQRQRPTFIERYSEPMAFLLSLFLALCGLIAGFNSWLTVRKKNRIDQYYSRLDALLDELNSHHVPQDRLDAIEKELLAMRHEAVRELVNERLLADESFQIFQGLLTDCHQQLAHERASDEGISRED